MLTTRRTRVRATKQKLLVGGKKPEAVLPLAHWLIPPPRHALSVSPVFQSNYLEMVSYNRVPSLRLCDLQLKLNKQLRSD